MPGEEFVHGIVEHLIDAMMQRTLIGSADVHTGLLTDSLKALHRAKVIGSVVFLYLLNGVIGRLFGHR